MKKKFTVYRYEETESNELFDELIENYKERYRIHLIRDEMGGNYGIHKLD